jgi:hypothetical protein
MEGRSLLELITGKIYEDVPTRPTIPNAVTLYKKLSLFLLGNCHNTVLIYILTILM